MHGAVCDLWSYRPVDCDGRDLVLPLDRPKDLLQILKYPLSVYYGKEEDGPNVLSIKGR
jgi:hypothetical protein